MKRGGQPRGRGSGGGERISDGELLRWAGDIARTRGRVQAARDVGLNYRTLARVLDDRRLSRLAREALLEAHRAESIRDVETVGEPDGALSRRLESAESQLADALDALGRERDRADALERRLESLEEQQARAPQAERPVAEPDSERPPAKPATRRLAGGHVTERPAVLASPPGQRLAHQPGVVGFDPLDGEEAALGEAAPLVAEWRLLRDGEAQHRSAVDRARAEERRWELEVELIGEHGLALPPETEPLHPSRRNDQLRWRRLTLQRARRQRLRAERLRLLRRILSLGLWRR